METTNTDNMLKDFFGEQKQEIVDNGFSRRVMRNLPEQSNRDWIVWVFAIIGLLLTTTLAVHTGLIQNIFMAMRHISIYYLLAVVFLFPLVGIIGFYFTQNKRYRII